MTGFEICPLKAFSLLNFKLPVAFEFIVRDLKQSTISFRFVSLFTASACSFDIE